jgi:hypothetical protein
MATAEGFQPMASALQGPFRSSARFVGGVVSRREKRRRGGERYLHTPLLKIGLRPFAIPQLDLVKMPSSIVDKPHQCLNTSMS